MRNDKLANQLLEGLPLIAETPASWAQLARENLDEVLRDHAWCEYKAASAGLGLLARFPELNLLIRPMIALVQEEMLRFGVPVRVRKFGWIFLNSLSARRRTSRHFHPQA